MEVAAVKLRNSYQIYYVDANNLFVNQNAVCLVETEHGMDIGTVLKSRNFQNNPSLAISGKLLRMTCQDDMNLLPEIEAIEDKAFKICKEKALAKKLDMKLISVKCLFDKTKIIFYFVAENRIDFRELVRELAAIFRTRIEMRQIGVRDEARLVGGYGPCGRQHCCVHKRQEFDPVSIKMAKEQDLNLNSLKISGMCGRLLCCLGYEYAVYKELNEKLPKLGTEIIAGDKKFTVESVDTLKESLQIKNAEQTIEISNNDIEIIKGVHILKKNVLDRINNPDDDTNEEF